MKINRVITIILVFLSSPLTESLPICILVIPSIKTQNVYISKRYGDNDDYDCRLQRKAKSVFMKDNSIIT